MLKNQKSLKEHKDLSKIVVEKDKNLIINNSVIKIIKNFL